MADGRGMRTEHSIRLVMAEEIDRRSPRPGGMGSPPSWEITSKLPFVEKPRFSRRGWSWLTKMPRSTPIFSEDPVCAGSFTWARSRPADVRAPAREVSGCTIK